MIELNRTGHNTTKSCFHCSSLGLNLDLPDVTSSNPDRISRGLQPLRTVFMRRKSTGFGVVAAQ